MTKDNIMLNSDSSDTNNKGKIHVLEILGKWGLLIATIAIFILFRL